MKDSKGLVERLTQLRTKHLSTPRRNHPRFLGSPPKKARQRILTASQAGGRATEWGFARRSCSGAFPLDRRGAHVGRRSEGMGCAGFLTLDGRIQGGVRLPTVNMPLPVEQLWFSLRSSVTPAAYIYVQQRPSPPWSPVVTGLCFHVWIRREDIRRPKDIVSFPRHSTCDSPRNLKCKS